MAGRFGKYGDFKRRKGLKRGRQEKARLTRSSSWDRGNRQRIIPSTKTSLHPENRKTYKTAVAVIPPDNLWTPIQAIRKKYDRHFRRWMPHITLLYPFRPSTEFEQIVPILAQTCRLQEPFEVRLKRINFFTHCHSSTFYLVPEPVNAIRALHQAILDKFSDCSDVALFEGGFKPHLSLGQIRSRDIEALCSRWQAKWRSLSFTLEKVHVFWRNDPPDDIFRIGHVLPLGSL